MLCEPESNTLCSLPLSDTNHRDPLGSGVTTFLVLGVFLRPAFLGQLTLLPLSLAFWLCVASPSQLYDLTLLLATPILSSVLLSGPSPLPST